MAIIKSSYSKPTVTRGAVPVLNKVGGTPKGPAASNGKGGNDAAIRTGNADGKGAKN